jgi:glycosyltransferase involved in cell wall biosynthesis
MKMFKVSVITTLYNYRNYIVDNIKSFLKQDFEDSELLIVDDASTDNPYKVIKKYESNRVKYIKLDNNKGYSYAKNTGIKQCNGGIIVMLDADDMFTKNGISIRYNKIMKGYDFVHGPCLNMKEGKPVIRHKMWKEWLETKNYKYVHAQGAMLRKDVHCKIGLYDEKLRCKSDREFFARVFNYKLKIGTVDEDVAIYRRHSKQMHCSKDKVKINKKLQKYVLALIEKRKIDLSGLELLDKF